MPDNRSSIPKLADVARLAAVGNATASRVLNGSKNVSEEAKARVMAATKDLGYQPNRVAQSLKGRSSRMIGMIVPSISDAFFSQCAEAVEQVARERGSLLVVLSAHDRGDLILSGIRQLLLHNMDGLILANSLVPSPELVDELRALRVPVVGIDGPLEMAGLPSVVCQNFQGACMATEHLLSHGYKSVISVQVKPSLYTMKERLRGYATSMTAAGRTPCQEVICDRVSAEEVLARHTRREPSFAVFAGNNLTAQHLCAAARSLRLRIPDQVAMVSFDDFDLADTLTPPMSVIRQPIHEIGRTAATLLFRRLLHSIPAQVAERSQTNMLAPELILRGSCGCPVGEIAAVTTIDRPRRRSQKKSISK